MTTVIPPRRQHPIAILRYSFRYLFLLSVPLLRGLRYIQTPQGLYRWAQGTWIDLSAILLLLVLPLLLWRGYTYSLTDQGFILRRGVLFRLETVIPRRHISTLSVERPFYLRPLRAARIAVDTDAGARFRADFTLTVSEQHAREILAERQKTDEPIQHRYRAPWAHIVVLSMLVSNSLSGVLILATAFYQSGRLLGEAYQQQLVGNLENAAQYLRIIPRTTALIVLVLLIGWGIAAMRNLLRHLPFCVTRYPTLLAIRHGAITRRDHLCTVSAVHYLDCRQTIFCKLLRLRIVFIHCIGYGKGRDSLSLLIPASPTARAEGQTRRLLPEFRPQAVTIRPAPRSLLRYIAYPLWGMLLIYPAARIIAPLFPLWREILLHLALIAYIPLVWAAAVKILDRYTAGIGCGNGFVTLQYSARLTFHTVTVPQSDIISYRFRQSVFQRRRHTGDLIILTYSEEPRRHRIRNIRETDAATFLHQGSQNQGKV